MKYRSSVGLLLALSVLSVGAEKHVVAVTQEGTPVSLATTTNSRTVIVTPAEFLTYFQRNGAAANFDYDT